MQKLLRFSFFLLVIITSYTNTLGAPSFRIQSSTNQPQYAFYSPGRPICIATFDIITGDEDLTGGGEILGDVEFIPTSSRTNSWWQWIWCIGMNPTNDQPLGDSGGGRLLENGLARGGSFVSTNTVFKRNTTNTINVELCLDWDTDFNPGDMVRFTSKDLCYLTALNGERVTASNEASNTVTLTIDSSLKIEIVDDSIHFQSTVPSRLQQYQLEQSKDLINWTVVSGSDDLYRTLMVGDFVFVLPVSKDETMKFFRLVPQHTIPNPG